jgi:hypothetical protein
MDPSSAFELARIFFAGISAAAAAIGVWQKSRDQKQRRLLIRSFQRNANPTNPRKLLNSSYRLFPLMLLSN